MEAIDCTNLGSNPSHVKDLGALVRTALALNQTFHADPDRNALVRAALRACEAGEPIVPLGTPPGARRAVIQDVTRALLALYPEAADFELRGYMLGAIRRACRTKDDARSDDVELTDVEIARENQIEVEASGDYGFGAATAIHYRHRTRPDVQALITARDSFASTAAAILAALDPYEHQERRAAARAVVRKSLIVRERQSGGMGAVLRPDGTYGDATAMSVIRSNARDPNILGWAAEHDLVRFDSIERVPQKLDRHELALVNSRDPLDQAEAVARGLGHWRDVTKPLAWSEILAEHSRVAARFEITMAAPRSYFDPNTEVFHDALYGGRAFDHVPEFSPDVDRYLRALFGSKYERGLDWLATVTDLARPTSALSLWGATGTGKSLFAALVASIWRGADVKFQQVVEQKTDGIRESPVIHADEGLPAKGPGGEDIGLFFRRFIGSSTFEWRRMYQPVVTVAGALRVVLTFNSITKLPFGASDLEPADREAIGQRILDIRVPDAAAAVVRDLGGRDTFDRWRESGVFARHVAWLTENRTVTPGTRFLVEGDGLSLVEQCCTRGGASAAVLDCLATVIAAPETIADPAHVLVDSEGLWVNASLFSGATWAAYSAEPPPGVRRAGAALSTVASGKRQRGAKSVMFHRVDLAALARHAAPLGITADDLARGVAALAAPAPDANRAAA